MAGKFAVPASCTAMRQDFLAFQLNGGDSHDLPLRDERISGSIFPGCPADTFAAMGDAFAAFGRDDQKLYTMPSLDLVVARLGDATQSDATALSHFDAQFLGLTRESFEQKSQK